MVDSFRRDTFSSKVGRLDIQLVSPSLIVTRMTGRLDVSLAHAFIGGLESWMHLGGSQLSAFHDWFALEDYDTDARIALTPWSKANKAAFAAVHLLVCGRALAFGIQIVNAIIGGLITMHHERASFDRALWLSGLPKEGASDLVR